MLKHLFSFYLMMSIFGPSFYVWAQSNCPKDFSKISSNCILERFQETNGKKDRPFSSRPIFLTPKMEGNIYFYKTASGELGKLKVISSVITPSVAKPTECTLFMDAVTYGANDKTYTPNTSLSVGASQSYFINDINYLDREGLSALELTRLPTDEDGKVIEVLDGDVKKILTPVLIDELYAKAITTGKNPEEAQKLKENLQKKISNAQMRCVILPTKGVEIGLQASVTKSDFKENNYLLFFAPLVLVFIAIFLIVRVLMEEQDKFKTQEALEDAENTNKNKNQYLFIKITKPFYKRYFVPLVQGSKKKQTVKAKYRQKIANAGLIKEMTPEEFLALKFFMILGGPFAFLTIRWVMSETWPLTITPVMGLVGYFYPDIWLSGLIKKRGDETIRAMPFIVDMLALSVEAGLDFMAAIQRVIEKAPRSPLVEEFETLIKETKIGSTRAEGLRQLGWRVNIIEINSFCATLIAADSVGASIAPILKQLSNELRVKRSSKAEQQGATAATKILIPMILFILPAVLIAIAIPFVLELMKGGGV